MCLICVEITKETLKPKDFWRNYREITFTDKHEEELIKALESTSKQYQKDLAEAMLSPEEGEQ